MINRRRSGARGTPAKVNATAGLEASEGVNSASVSDGSHESVYLGPFYVTPPVRDDRSQGTGAAGGDGRPQQSVRPKHHRSSGSRIWSAIIRYPAFAEKSGMDDANSRDTDCRIKTEQLD